MHAHIVNYTLTANSGKVYIRYAGMYITLEAQMHTLSNIAVILITPPQMTHSTHKCTHLSKRAEHI